MTSPRTNDPAKEQRELRNYGILMAVVLGAIGGFLKWRGHAPWTDLLEVGGRASWTHFLELAVVFAIVALVVPANLRPIYKVWMKFAEALGWINTRIILSVIFYLIFTPYGLIARLFGKDLLDLKWKRRADSYWLPAKEQVEDKKRYERMY